MLVLTCSEGEVVEIGPDIQVQFVTQKSWKKIRLGIQAPETVAIVRANAKKRKPREHGGACGNGC